MTTQEFSSHLDCLFDRGVADYARIPGPCPIQLLFLYQAGFYCDDIDRLYLDYDICGGE